MQAVALLASLVHAADAGEPREVVFRQTTRWDAARNRVSTETVGSLDVTLGDGRAWRVDAAHPEAPDGTWFSFEWESGHEGEGAPEFSRVVVVRHARRPAPVGIPASGQWREPRLVEWLAGAKGEERAQVEVSFLGRAPPEVPVEARQPWVDAFQAAYVREAESAGATGLRSGPNNSLALEAPAWLLRRWSGDPTVEGMGFREVGVNTSDGP